MLSILINNILKIRTEWNLKKVGKNSVQEFFSFFVGTYETQNDSKLSKTYDKSREVRVPDAHASNIQLNYMSTKYLINSRIISEKFSV